jgi:outer membrane protein OmpA-like peptidoglycan-associated protein
MRRWIPALGALFAIALAAPAAHGHGRLVNFTIDIGGSVPFPSSGLKETTFKQYPYWADACNPQNDPDYDEPDLSPGPGYNGYLAICNPVSGGFNYAISMDFDIKGFGIGLGYASSVFARMVDPNYRPEELKGENRGDKSPYIAHHIFLLTKLRLLDFAGAKYKRKWGSLDLELRWGYGGLYGKHSFFQMSQGLSYMFALGNVFQLGFYLSFNEAIAFVPRENNPVPITWGPTADGRTGAITAFEGDKNEVWMSFGMRMAIGFADFKKKPKKEDEFGDTGESEYAEQMKLMDQDSDGLSDYAEMMLGTDAKNRDSDGDTIPDGIEDANVNGVRDPGETNPAMYDTDVGGVNDGWEIQNGYDPMNPDDDDRDLDGVMDDVDACPGTPPGSEVGSAGCPTLTESVILDQVTFVEGTSELNPEAYTQLDQYAMILLQDPELEVVILVFGPPSGNKKKISRLTEDQAEIIKDYLVMRGLDEARIVVSGEGKASDGPKVELQPIIPLF